jgi:hypothetical protein
MSIIYLYFFTLILFGEAISIFDRLCGLVVRVLGYNPEVPDSIPGATKFSEK